MLGSVLDGLVLKLYEKGFKNFDSCTVNLRVDKSIFLACGDNWEGAVF